MYWKIEQFKKTVEDTNFALDEAEQPSAPFQQEQPDYHQGGGFFKGLAGIARGVLQNRANKNNEQQYLQQFPQMMANLHDEFMKTVPQNGKPTYGASQTMKNAYDQFMNNWNAFSKHYKANPPQFFNAYAKQTTDKTMAFKLQDAARKLQGQLNSMNKYSNYFSPYGEHGGKGRSNYAREVAGRYAKKYGMPADKLSPDSDSAQSDINNALTQVKKYFPQGTSKEQMIAKLISSGLSSFVSDAEQQVNQQKGAAAVAKNAERTPGAQSPILDPSGQPARRQ